MMHLSYYKKALALELDPILLEFTHPRKDSPLYICGIKPKSIFQVIDGKLYQDDKHIGCALDIFTYLTINKVSGSHFFPAFLGYFTYEFAKYFLYPTKKSSEFPDAYFALYTEGLVIDDNNIIHHDDMGHENYEPSHKSLMLDLKPSISENEFITQVNIIKDSINQGDVYQVNFSLPFYVNAHADDMMSIYEAMREHNPSPFMGMLHNKDFSILSGSPERLFSLHHDIITCRPIAGTKKRMCNLKDDDANMNELLSCPKENAEHAMLLDLIRNDMHQIAEAGSLKIIEDRSVEFYSHVMHLVSRLVACSKHSLKDIMRAIFPGGTITGAPKYNVMKMISDIEHSPRGPYTGCLGYISSGYGIDFNILIRSLFRYNNITQINTGAGIVIDSDPQKEWLEVNLKINSFRDILLGCKEKHIKRNKKIRHFKSNLKDSINIKNAHILFYENNDSFSFNIIALLKELGADLDIASSKHNLYNYSHIIIGPGPGTPKDMPHLSHIINEAMAKNIPLLGICLGHQAIGYTLGASIRKAIKAIHGESRPIYHHNQGLFLGLTSPLMHTRYHSLVIDHIPNSLIIDAYSDDDEIMAIRHKTKPLWGLQFHPESYLSNYGHDLLSNFLQNI